MAKLDILRLRNDFQKTKLRHNKLSDNGSTYINSNIKGMSLFQDIKSDNFKLPIIVSGRLVSSGVYHEKFGDLHVSSDELKKTVDSWKGISIFKSHGSWIGVAKGENIPIDDIVGKIIGTSWNEEDQGIDYVAEIMDRNVAYKIAKELIQTVSVGFGRSVVWDNGLAFAKGLEPKELSLVFNGKDKKATISVQKIEY